MKISKKNICLSLSGKTFVECKAQINNADIIELRLDRIQMQVDEVKQIVSLGQKWIVSVRENFFNNKNYENLFLSSLSENLFFVDFDFDLIKRKEGKKILQIAISNGYSLMFSFHNFEFTPNFDFLKNIANNIFDSGADAAKIVCKGNSTEDANKVLRLYDCFDNITAFCMGDICRNTRLIALQRGLQISYSYPDNGEALADGQFSFSEMLDYVNKMQFENEKSN